MISASHHPLAGSRDVPLAQLKGEAFVDFEPDWGTRRLVDRAFFESAVERHTAFEVSDLESLLALVSRGLGIALIPEAIAEARYPSLGIAHLAGPELCWELVVAYASDGANNAPADPAPRAFLDLLADRAIVGAESDS